MRILVTGGAGFVGSHTCVALLEAGHEVAVLDDFSNSHFDVLPDVMKLTGKTLEWLKADICNRDMIASFIAQGSFDVVMHFAALKSAPESIEQPLRYWEVNVAGTTALVRACLDAGIDKFVFSSSAIIYGAQERTPIPESAQPGPSTPYAWTKLAGEHLLLNLSESRPDFQVCILRYFNPIGAHSSGQLGENSRQQASNLFPIVLSACRNGLTVDVYGGDYSSSDGSAIRDFIHIMDVAEGHLAAVNLLAQNIGPAKSNAWTFNLGTGKGTTVLQLIGAMEKASGQTISIRKTMRRPGDIGVSVADPSLATTSLRCSPQTTIDDACRYGLLWCDKILQWRS